MAYQTNPPVTTDPLAVSVRAAAHASGVGRTRLYEAMGTGELPSCKVGKRRLILFEDLRAWLGRQRQAAASPGPTAAETRRARAEAGR